MFLDCWKLFVCYTNTSYFLFVSQSVSQSVSMHERMYVLCMYVCMYVCVCVFVCMHEYLCIRLGGVFAYMQYCVYTNIDISK